MGHHILSTECSILSQHASTPYGKAIRQLQSRLCQQPVLMSASEMQNLMRISVMHPSHGLAWSHTLWEHKMQQGHGFTLTCALIHPLHSMPEWLHAAPHTYQLVTDHSLEDWHICTAWGSTPFHSHMHHRVNMPVQVYQAEQDCSKMLQKS